MSCTECKYAPKTYGEYCVAQSNQKEYCPDAFTGKSSLCELYTDTKGDFDEDKKKFLELINDYYKEGYRAGYEEALRDMSTHIDNSLGMLSITDHITEKMKDGGKNDRRRY